MSHPEDRPAGHIVQLADPAVDVLPAGQSAQTPLFGYVLMGQGLQTPFCRTEPGAQAAWASAPRRATSMSAPTTSFTIATVQQRRGE